MSLRLLLVLSQKADFAILGWMEQLYPFLAAKDIVSLHVATCCGYLKPALPFAAQSPFATSIPE